MSDASLFMVSLIVPDMDDAIVHFTNAWGFTLTCDTRHVSGHRWVEVAPDSGARLRLVQAINEEQCRSIGQQVGGRVAFFLKVTSFDEALLRWVANGVEIVEPERLETYGRLVVLRDKFGNRWDVFDAKTEVMM